MSYLEYFSGALDRRSYAPGFSAFWGDSNSLGLDISIISLFKSLKYIDNLIYKEEKTR